MELWIEISPSDFSTVRSLADLDLPLSVEIAEGIEFRKMLKIPSSRYDDLPSDSGTITIGSGLAAATAAQAISNWLSDLLTNRNLRLSINKTSVQIAKTEIERAILNELKREEE